MDFEENENSITAGTSTESQQSLLQRKRPRLQVRPNMSCGINVSVNKICYFLHVYLYRI